MRLNEYLDVSKLAEHLKDGVVDVRVHKTLPLVIYCYSRKATFDNIWDDVTTKTRGLIVDANTLDIIARPFEKFFNLNHAGRPETDMLAVMKESSAPVFSEKLDGSMGTFWRYKLPDGRIMDGIATKGSFHSEQAEWATAWYNDHQCGRLSPGAWPVGYTPIFEIIAQSVQHHVVHYLPNEDNRLVLIALVNNETGAEMEPEQLMTWAAVNGLDVVDTWRDLSIYEASQIDREGKEGYIATWYRNGAPPLKVKIKHPTFLKLQKIAHHTTPKTIFQALREDDGLTSNLIDDALQFGSPYLQDQVRTWVKLFTDEYKRLMEDVRELLKQALTCTTDRKEFAAFVIGTNKYLSAAAFNLLDEKPMNLRETIWDLVEPLIKTIKYDEVESES